MPEDTVPNDLDDELNVLDAEDALARDPWLVAFGDHAKPRMLRALALAYPNRLNATQIIENAGLSDRNRWYQNKDDLLASGLVVQDGDAGNSPLYKFADNDDAQQLRSLIWKLADRLNGNSGVAGNDR